MKIRYLIWLLSGIVLHADMINDVINQHIRDEQQKKIFNEQKDDANIKRNKADDTKLLEIEKDSIEENCIKVKKININNSTVFEDKDFEELIAPYLNNCNGMKNLSNLRDKISNLYIDKGYVTSRAYFKPQDLSTGIVDIDIFEGKIEKIEEEGVNTSTLYLYFEDRILNLRDLEVGIEQAQRLSSQKVDLQLIPGTKTGYTIVKIVGENISKPYYGNIGVNNLGTRKTGKNQISTNFVYENLLNINDIVNLNLNSTNNILKDNNKTLSSMFSYSFPIERFLFNVDLSHSNYKQLNKDEFGSSFQSDGMTNSILTGVNYKLFHTINHSLEIISTFEKKKNENYLNDVRLELQSYELDEFGVGFKHSYLEDSYNYYSKIMAYKSFNGSSASFAKQDIDYSKYVLDLNFTKTFDTQNQLKFNTNLRGQYSNKYLFGTEEIAMGGVYSVRGFNQSGLSGNSGFYDRNELSVRYLIDENIIISPYIGVDFGHVINDENNIYGNIVGGAIGCRFTLFRDLNVDIFYSLPLKDSKFTKDKSENFTGLNISYNF